MKQQQIVKHLIRDLTNGTTNSFVILGSAGQGKTEITFETLKELGYKENIHFRYLANYITPRGLIDLLQEINELKPPKLLILDDITTTLKNILAVEILKGALWTANDKRRILWKTHRDNIEFDFYGKIIIILNQLAVDNPIINSLIDRSSFYEIRMTNQEIQDLIKERAKQPALNIPLNKRLEIANYVCEKGRHSKKFSLRVLPMAYSLYKSSPHHWQTLITTRL